ncbi:MAG: hypothetical protein ABIW38_04160 [Ferruginibacter sp.]
MCIAIIADLIFIQLLSNINIGVDKTALLNYISSAHWLSDSSGKPTAKGFVRMLSGEDLPLPAGRLAADSRN